jgi:hypothetical protein
VIVSSYFDEAALFLGETYDVETLMKKFSILSRIKDGICNSYQDGGITYLVINHREIGD